MVVGDDINKYSDDANKHDDIGCSSKLNMTFGDTLYLHPNDTGGSPIVTIKVTVKAAFAVVSGEESHRNATFVVATKPTATAFVARTFDNKKRFNSNNNSGSNTNSNNKGPNPNLKCTNCNKIGHTVNRCFELVGYSAYYVKKNFNANTKPVSSNNVSTSASLMFILIILGWIVDSGKNQHMPVSAKFLINVVDISNIGLIMGHPNVTRALITKIGDLKINNDITLYDVLVVPEYIVSLLYVHKLARYEPSNTTLLNAEWLKINSIILSWIFTTIAKPLQSRLADEDLQPAKEVSRSLMSDEDIVSISLEGLPTKYDNVYGIIVHQASFPDLKTVCSMLTTEEMRLNSRAQDTFVGSTSSSPMVLLANSCANTRRSTPSMEKKLKPCFNFNKGSCRLGAYCKFLHNGVHGSSLSGTKTSLM
ncbi:ribonuclease H-like domain-containing protein [Tanacetum coccineum]